MKRWCHDLLFLVLALGFGCAPGTSEPDLDSECPKCDRGSWGRPGRPEPQALDPARDAELIGNLGLLQAIPERLPRFNLLVIGQDRETGGAAYAPGRPGLSSRADSINIVSVNRLTWAIELIAVYHGTMVPDSCWGESTPPADRDQRYLANVYRMGRRAFVPCLEHLLGRGLGHADATRTLLDPQGRFEIHAIIEANHKGFRDLLGSVTLARSLESHLRRLAHIGYNAGAALTTMRERTLFPAAGYQRAFNHAKFLTTGLGYIAYGRRFDPELVGKGQPFYAHLSRSMSLDLLAQAFSYDGLRPGAALQQGACFRQGQSRITIFALGSAFAEGADFLLHRAGETDLDHAKTPALLAVITDQAQLEALARTAGAGLFFIPAPDDCP